MEGERGAAVLAPTCPLRGGRRSASLLAELREGVNRGEGMPHRPVPPTNRRFGKAMRRHMTDAEARLWLRLRKPGIDGLRFRRQAPIGPYIVDFFCPQHRLIVEVDGGQHADDARDRERDAWLAAQGYRVVRVWNNEVMENVEGVCAAIPGAARGAAPLTPSRNR